MDACETCKLMQLVLTQGCIRDPIHLQDEVVFEEDVTNNGEQVD